jgi:hypothetical protein
MTLLPDYLNPQPGAVAPTRPLPAPDELLSLLGYRQYQITDSLRSQVRINLFPFEQQRVGEILTELAATDAAIKEAVADSAITKTCDSEIDWSTQVRLLRQQGHELLLELARIYDVDIAYSRFVKTPVRQYQIQYQ